MTLKHAVTVEASVTSKNLSKVALLRVVQQPFIALFAIIAPRLMGPTLYAHYSLFVSIVGMGTALLDLGMTEISVRHGAGAAAALRSERDLHVLLPHARLQDPIRSACNLAGGALDLADNPIGYSSESWSMPKINLIYYHEFK